MKYLKKFENTSATGGNGGAIIGGEVYSMPVGNSSELTPNSIKRNTGGSLDLDKDILTKVNLKKIKRKKFKKRKQNIENKQKIMNWDLYLNTLIFGKNNI